LGETPPRSVLRLKLRLVRGAGGTITRRHHIDGPPTARHHNLLRWLPRLGRKIGSTFFIAARYAGQGRRIPAALRCLFLVHAVPPACLCGSGSAEELSQIQAPFRRDTDVARRAPKGIADGRAPSQSNASRRIRRLQGRYSSSGDTILMNRVL